jgi:hypothetical protein
VMLLVSGTTRSVGRLAATHPNHLGHLLTPTNRNGMDAILGTGLSWAADNGCYSGFDPDRFRRFLRKIAGRPRLLWVACPDVVADAAATLARFDQWHAEVAAAGPVAFVGQDGQESLPLPWDRFACLFVGGSTDWKLSNAAHDLALEAKRRGKWVHLGRCNSFRRTQLAFDMGCDSIDGSSFSMFGDTYIRRQLRFMRRLPEQPSLPW